ncbi:hypothetical protein [Tardiphaga sp. 285_C5_N1_2]|uniref:hypothetical protein n=1 Tax=Tardiphaga sp. 285_C5_N1_2 TaxID=3240775 RepID=UPI003F8984F2
MSIEAAKAAGAATTKRAAARAARTKRFIVPPLRVSICSEAAERGTDCARVQKKKSMRRKLELAIIAIYGAVLVTGISVEAIASIAK